MRILIVCSGNKENFVFEKDMAFVYDQMKAIEKLNKNIEFDLFLIRKKGINGYIKERKRLKDKIKQYNPDIIHSHGGHTGIVTLFQGVPDIVTFHGSEINIRKMRWLSGIVFTLSDYSIIVSSGLEKILTKTHKNYSVIPCGVDFSIFYPMDKTESKKKLGIPFDKNYVLFSSGFDNEIKNYPLAKEVMSHFPDFAFKEIKDNTREEVNLLINGAEALLMTSYSEGSPQIIKEALACNQRILSVDIGDVSEQLTGVKGCMISSHNPDELKDKLSLLIKMPQPINGRISAEKYNNEKIAERILDVYQKVLKA